MRNLVKWNNLWHNLTDNIQSKLVDLNFKNRTFSDNDPIVGHSMNAFWIRRAIEPCFACMCVCVCVSKTGIQINKCKLEQVKWKHENHREKHHQVNHWKYTYELYTMYGTVRMREYIENKQAAKLTTSF